MGVRYTVLGEVGVAAPGAPVVRTEPRHRAVLAYLLLHARTVIGTDRLIGAMWGTLPPDSARAQIHASIAVIRRVLREAGAADVLRTRAGGYVILPGPGELDLEEFTALTAGEDVTADGLRTALGLWRGRPLADVGGDYVDEARARLEERRITAVERLADLELAAGRHRELVDELTAETALHPLRERLTGQLMLALHRSGRQADALAAGRAFRAGLADAQGLDPGRAFTTLEQRILRDDPELAPAPAAEPGPPARPPAPEQRKASFLPFDLPDFAGRDEEIERIVASLPVNAGGMTISAISGMAGSGKTALAVHVAHRLADRYPDGRLFVDLRAHTAGQEPLAACAALETLLRQLGVPAEAVPAATDDRAALWRQQMADRRALVVLDNAADTAQVLPLLPGPCDSLFLVTSRRRLVDLDGAHTVSIDPLPARDALDLFTSIVGERATAEPLAVMDVLQLCGFLPLAVRIAAARLHHRPRWTVEYLAGRLRDQRGRLAELATSGRGVAAAFTLSYDHLTPEQQRMFRLASLHPGADFDPYAAAALAATSLDDAEELLEDLLDAHVLTQRDPGRYTFHDLLREHAHATALAEDPPAVRDAARTRLLDHLLYTACAAVDLLFPEGAARRPRVPRPDGPSVPLHDPAAWLDAERANLVAAGVHAADRPGYTSDLAATLHHYFDARADHVNARTLHTRAVQAGLRHDDKAAARRALTDLGRLNARQGLLAEALDNYRQGLDLHRESNERTGEEARLLNNIGDLHLWQGRLDEAEDHYQRALALFRELGIQVGEAASLTKLGTVRTRQGRPSEAIDHHRSAIALYRPIGYHRGEATALDHLGLAYRAQGALTEAADHHRRALALYREHRYRGYESEPTNGLGEVAQASGDLAQAADHHRTALALATEAGSLPEQARAHLGLARTDPSHARHALDLYTRLGMPEAAEARRLDHRRGAD